MARKRLFYICFLLLFILAKGVFSQCNPGKIAKTYKPNLEPYRYDSYDYNEVSFNNAPQTIEVLFTAFAGMKYKLVFGTSMFDENVKVNIYDKSINARERIKLF